jgi:hypothetical protein
MSTILDLAMFAGGVVVFVAGIVSPRQWPPHPTEIKGVAIGGALLLAALLLKLFV